MRKLRYLLFIVALLHITETLYSLPVNESSIDFCTLTDKATRKCGDLTHICVDQRQFCDGKMDCPNGFDELNCHDELPTWEEYMEMEYLFCKPNEFKCSNGVCISLDLVCDGKPDCRKHDDEGNLCGQCEGFGCGDRCQDFPQGPKCMCPSNMFLSVDGKTCEHHNMCSVGEHECSHHCTQIHDRVICSCSNGYTLSRQFECEVNEEHRNGQLFFTYDNNSIRRIELFGNSSGTMEEVISPSPALKKISSISFSQPQQLLYYVDNESHRASMIFAYNGVESKGLYFGFGIKHIAVDWITGNIYYAADGLGIGVCTSDGRYCSHLLVGHISVRNERLQTYGDLVVHPRRGILLWLDFNAEHPNGVVMAMGMDGKLPRVVVSVTAKLLHSLSVDYVRDCLYYLEGEELQVIDLKTLEKKRISARVHPYSMITFDAHFFYVNRENKNLVKNTNRGEEVRVYEMLKGDDFSMTVNNSLYYEKFSNPCNNIRCSHMCALKEEVHDHFPQAKCMCPDKYSFAADGGCILDREVDGPVRTSSAHMSTMCAQNLACFNGGVCKESIEDGDTTPSCDCIRGFNGLYCERYIPGDYDEGSSWVMVFLMLFMFLSIAVAVAVFVLKMYPEKKPKFESFANINASPILERSPQLLSPNTASDTNRPGPVILSC